MNDVQFRVPWSSVRELLQQSLFAEEMVCSMSSQLFHIPQLRDLKGNREMHQHLVPASYHRLTASGSAYRLSMGERDGSIVKTLAACIENADKQDKDVKKWLLIMNEAAPQEYKSFVRQIVQWQNQAEYYLISSKQVLIQWGIYSPQNDQGGNYAV